MKLLHRLARLSSAELTTLLMSTLLVSCVRLALWLVPFRFFFRLLEKTVSAIGRQDLDPNALKQLVWSIEQASRLIPRATCLVQAVAAQLLLARFGQAADLRIGVAKDETDRFQAHAWLEYKGEIIIGGSRSRSRFTAFPLFDLNRGRLRVSGNAIFTEERQRGK